MTLFLALALSLASAAHAQPPPALVGLGTAGGSLVLAVPGALGGFAAWNALDGGDPTRCQDATDNCNPAPIGRSVFLGMPLGASLAEVGGGVLTHHLLVGSGSGKVALAGAGATGASFALIGAGVAFYNSDERGTGAALILTGMAASVVAPPIAMGVVSGHQARVSTPREGLVLNELGYVHVEGGGGLRLGGQW